MENIILYSNAALWVLTLLFWWRKKRSNVGIIVLALYSAVAIVSCHLYQQPDMDEYRNVTLFPFIYLYITITALIYPLFKTDIGGIQTVKLPPLKIMNVLCVFIIICSLYQLFNTLPEINKGIGLMLLDSTNAVDAYIDTTEANMTNKSLSGAVSILGVLSTTGVGFAMLFFFIYLLYPNKNKWILYGMIISSLIVPISSLASGSREKVVTTIIVFMFMFLLLRPLLTKKTSRIISGGTLIVAGLMLILFFIISFARSRGDYEKLLLSFESYFGMSFIVFNDKCISAVGTREGNWVSPLINVLLGGRSYSQIEIRDKYSSLGIDNGVFYTFVGDFVLDYGPILAFIILILISCFFSKKLRLKNTINAGHIVLYYMLLKLLSGFYLHQYVGIGGNLLIVELLILYLLFSDKSMSVSYKRTL
jgi:oligosaccharide repeat unit polymerase